jgi:hypothetical protein
LGNNICQPSTRYVVGRALLKDVAILFVKEGRNLSEDLKISEGQRLSGFEETWELSLLA